MTFSIHPGLCSITFRKKSPEEIISLAQTAQLSGIEWGGDVHVPPGNIPAAQDIARQTRSAGLEIPSFGSYYRLGVTAPADAADILAAAKALGAGIVRVWAGNQGSADASPEFRKSVVQDALALADAAAEKGLKIACEWHGNTLTDTLESSLQFLAEANHPNFGVYWQPRNGQSAESRQKDIAAILPRLMGLHVFHWSDAGERLPLSQGVDVWIPALQYLVDAASQSGIAPLYAHLEFTAGDDDTQMKEDAVTLRGWLHK